MPTPSLKPCIQRFLESENKITDFTTRSEYFHEARSGNIRVINSRDHYLIVEIGFLSLMLEWEIFIENVFCRLLCNSKRSSRPQPQLLIGGFTNIETTRSTLHGKVGYFRWIDPSELVRLSQKHFRNGEPFLTPINAAYQQLDEARIIRNRIGHSSAKAESAFLTMIQTKYGYSPKAMTPGRFLLDKLATNTLRDEYILYARTLTTVAQLIVG